MNPLYEQMETSVFERMSLAAAKNGAVNLGQGFPDFGWPPEILEAAAKSVVEGSNQYAPSRGLPALREAVASHYNRHQNLDLSADNICVTSGATEALAAAILATVEPGDEVIILTPAYDAYAPLIRRAGGLPVEVAFAPGRIERAALEAAISPRTRAIVFNNPHNPTGRLFDREELEVIAEVAVTNDLIVISDEVWEHILLDGQSFTPIASLAGMDRRTLKCGSAGNLLADRMEEPAGFRIGRAGDPGRPRTAPTLRRRQTCRPPSPTASMRACWLQPMRDRFTGRATG
jgi:aspartate/methionine/tyrosine aminotransferase